MSILLLRIIYVITLLKVLWIHSPAARFEQKQNGEYFGRMEQIHHIHKMTALQFWTI